MSMLSHPAFGPKVALVYVTVGALIDVWTAVYYFAYGRNKMNDDNVADDNRTWFWVAGFFLTGLTLVILGLVLGPLGRAARRAELPPAEATRDEAIIKQQLAAAAHPAAAAQAAGVAPAPAVPTPAAPIAPPQPTRPPAGYPQPTL